MAELADVVIVGGGVLGVALAYELARRTMRVTLLEAHALASAATGSGFGWINATSKDDDADYHRLNVQGMTAYERLAEQWGAAQIGLNGGGSLQWATEEVGGSRERLLNRSAALNDLGYPVSLLTAREMRTLEPQIAFPEDAQGLFAPADRWLDAPRLVRFLAQESRKMKATIREYCPVTGFSLGLSRKITAVRTVDGEIATPLLILAAGLQTPGLVQELTDDVAAAACVPVQATAGLLVETGMSAANGSVHRVLYPPDSDGLHFRPTPGGGILLGADDGDLAVQRAANAGLESVNGGNIPKDAPAALWNRLLRVLPNLSVEAVPSSLSARLCYRPMPADERPIIGTIPGVHNVFVAVTHSGVTLGPCLAHLLADEICGTHLPPELTPYRPQRFLGTSMF